MDDIRVCEEELGARCALSPCHRLRHAASASARRVGEDDILEGAELASMLASSMSEVWRLEATYQKKGVREKCIYEYRPTSPTACALAHVDGLRNGKGNDHPDELVA